MKYRLLTAGLLLFFRLSSAQDSKGQYNFNLQECIDYSYQHQSKIVNADIDTKIAENKVREVLGIGLPQVTGNVNFQDFLELPTTLIPASFAGGKQGEYIPFHFGTKYNMGLSLDISQIIFDGSYLVGLQATSVYQDLSKKNLARTKIETNVAVSKAYYTVLVTQARMELLEANVSRLKKLSEDTKALYKNGFVEKIDNDRIEVLYNNIQVEKEKVTQFAALTYLLLKFQMGMGINEQLTLKDKLSEIEFQPILSNSTGAANYEARMEYSLLQTQKKLYELDLKKNKLSYLPSVIGFGSFSKSGYNDSFKSLFNGDITYYPTSLIGLKISIPILGGGQKYFRLQQAKLNVKKAENDLNSLKIGIELDQRQAEITYTANVQSLQTQKKNMELAEEVFRVSKLKYDQGIGSNLEVVNAETSLKEAQTNYINSLYDALVSKVELDRSLGNIK